MMIKEEALRYLHDVGRQSALADHLTRTDDEDLFLIPNENGGRELLRLPLYRQPIDHIFESLDSFCEFVNGPHCDESRAVAFVEHTRVWLDLDYRGHREDSARLDLKFTPERLALNAAFQPTKSKDFWRMLIGPLAGHIDGALVGLIANLKVRTTGDQTVAIDEYGIQSGGVFKDVTLLVGEGKAVIPLEWEFTGALWRCWDHKITVSLRLEIDVDGGLHFLFHAPELYRAEQEARRQLLTELQARCKGLAIYEGVH